MFADYNTFTFTLCCHVLYILNPNGIFFFFFQQYSESALLFEKGQYWEKAAAVYIKTKNW